MAVLNCSIDLLDQLARVRDQLKEIDALAFSAVSSDACRDDPDNLLRRIFDVIVKVSDTADIEAALATVKAGVACS